MADGYLVPGDLLTRMTAAMRRVESGDLDQRDSWSGGPQSFREFPIVRVRNDTNADLGVGEAVGLGDLLDPSTLSAAEFAQACLTFAGETPAEGHEGKFAIIREPIAAGDYGYAAISGAWPAIVNKQDDADTRAEIDPGATVLIGGSTGSVKILKSESGVGNKWAIVRFDEVGTSDTRVAWINDDTEMAPAYAVLEVQSIDTDGIYHCKRPQKVDYSSSPSISGILAPARVYLVNDAADVYDEQAGFAYCAWNSPPLEILYDTGDGTPANNETWGPYYDSWELHKGVPGFTILGNPRSGRVTAFCRQPILPNGALTLTTSCDAGVIEFDAQHGPYAIGVELFTGSDAHILVRHPGRYLILGTADLYASGTLTLYDSKIWYNATYPYYTRDKATLTLKKNSDIISTVYTHVHVRESSENVTTPIIALTDAVDGDEFRMYLTSNTLTAGCVLATMIVLRIQ